jgi:hypothetical protein
MIYHRKLKIDFPAGSRSGLCAIGFSLRRWAFSFAFWDRDLEDFRTVTVFGFHNYFAEKC